MQQIFVTDGIRRAPPCHGPNVDIYDVRWAMMQGFQASEEPGSRVAGTHGHTPDRGEMAQALSAAVRRNPPKLRITPGVRRWAVQMARRTDGIPPRRHRCWPQSRNWHDTFDLVERCPCGGIRIGGRGRWWRRNSAAATGLRRRWLERGKHG